MFVIIIIKILKNCYVILKKWKCSIKERGNLYFWGVLLGGIEY